MMKRILLTLFSMYEIANRQDKLFKKWLHKIEEKPCEIRFHLFLGLSHIDLTGESLSKKLMSEVFKFVLFDKWLKANGNHATLTNEFLKSVDSKDFYEFFSKVFQMNSVAVNEHIISREIYPELWVVLDYFSRSVPKGTEWNELGDLRKKPLYQLKNGNYLILDFGFILDKFFSGIYHDLVGMASANKSNFHLDYSKEFVEEALLVNSLKATFGKSYLQFSEKRMKANGKKVENLAMPDYYIRNGNKVMIFECKNSFLSQKNKVSLDCDLIETEIMQKFVENSGKRKAVRQLSNFISNASNGKYLYFDNVKKLSNIVYYPILVVTDSTLTSIGFNKLFNEYFDKDLIEKDPGLKKRIKPLTIIHINDFLYYNVYLKKLDAEINNYNDFLQKQNVIDRMISFSTYLHVERLLGKKSLNRNNLNAILRDSFLSEEKK